MKLVKLSIGIVFALVVLVAIAAAVVANNLNDIVKTLVEDVGSEALQTKVAVAEIDISLLRGRVVVSGMTIDNPGDFSAPTLFEIDTFVVAFDLMSLLDNIVFVEEILIDGADVVVEQKGLTTNVQALLDGMQKANNSTTDIPPDNSDDGQDSSSADKFLVKVGQFQFSNSSAKLITEKWGEKSLALDEITLQNLGGDAGVPPQALAREILDPIIEEIQSSTEQRLKEIAKEKFKEKLKEETDSAKEKISEKIKDVFGEESVNKLKSLFSK